jgi:hypothetical protein
MGTHDRTGVAGRPNVVHTQLGTSDAKTQKEGVKKSFSSVGIALKMFF